MPDPLSVNGSSIVLSFDDGPGRHTTPDLLRTLDRFGVSAMFFVNGSRLGDDWGRGILQDIHDRGHVIGNHSFSHRVLPELSRDQVCESLKKTHDLILRVADSCVYFRAPYGSLNQMVCDVALELGYIHLAWNVDPRDWEEGQQANGRWVEDCIGQLRKRHGSQEPSVVVLHDIHRSTVDHVARLVEIAQSEPHRLEFWMYRNAPQAQGHQVFSWCNRFQT